MRKHTYIPWPCEEPGPWAGVWLESVGYRDCRRDNVEKKPYYFCLHLIVQGQLRFRTDNDVDVILGRDDLFAMWPDIGCQFYAEPPSEGEDVWLDWIRLKGPLARHFMRLLGTTEDQPFARAARPQKARNLMHSLQVLAKEYPDHADLTSISMLHQFAAACGKPRVAKPGDRAPAQRIKDAMEQHVGSAMNVADFAKAFRTSQSNLFLMFKKAFKKSPIQVLTEIRITRARELLKDTELSIAEVAVACGYNDPLYFSRQFRKQTRKAPRAFREALR